MTQTRIHRFDFNTLRDFRGPIVMKATDEPLVVDLPPPPPPPVYNEAQLEAAQLEAKKQGYADGFLAGQKEAQMQADAKLSHAHEVIAQLAGTVEAMQARYLELLSSESQQLSQLVLAIAQKVIGSRLQSADVAAIQHVVTQCLPVIFSKPKLVVELNPEMFEFTINYIEEQLRQAGFEGEIQFKGNPALGTSDVTLDWGSDQMQRSADALWAEVETLIARMPLNVTLALPPETNESEHLTGE
jgi:flagellar assembly protein FliH